MSRRYAHQITVQCSSPSIADEAPTPQRFVWRRRRYRIRAVVQHWVEVGSWWRSASAADVEYEVWRVEAATERRLAPVGQYDLCQHQGSGHWFLVRAFD